jgi:hypothetical protein
LGHLPPVLGALSAAVTTKRLDLVSLRGHIVRVPRTLDVDIAEGSTRVWVHEPGMDLSGGGPFTFPTVVLTADELRIVKQGLPDDGEPVDVRRDAVAESHSEFPLKVALRAEARSFKERVSSALKTPGVVRKRATSVAVSPGTETQEVVAGEAVEGSEEQSLTHSLSAENSLARKARGRDHKEAAVEGIARKPTRGRSASPRRTRTVDAAQNGQEKEVEQARRSPRVFARGPMVTRPPSRPFECLHVPCSMIALESSGSC